MSVRDDFLSSAAPSGAAPRRPFESMLLRGLVPAFLDRLALLLSARLRRETKLRPAGAGQRSVVEAPHYFFMLKVFQSRTAFGLPADLARILGAGLLGVPLSECAGEPAEEDLATIRELIMGIVRSEEPFSKFAVFVEEIRRAAFSENFGLEHELLVELDLGAGSFFVPIRLDDRLLERIRVYGRISARPLLSRMKPNVTWSLIGHRALGSFKILLELAPGRRVPMSEFFSRFCELRQETPGGAHFPLVYGSTLTFVEKKEAA